MEQKEKRFGNLDNARWSGAIPLLSGIFMASSTVTFVAWWLLIR